MRIARLFAIGLICLAAASMAAAAERIIFDTDLGADCDDAGTFAVLHALADKGEVEILAVGIVNNHPKAVPAADAINTWFGRPDLPVGTIKRNSRFSHDMYLSAVVAGYPHDLTKEAAPDVVKLYRKILAASSDRSVTLVAVGPATNISDLLDSGPDEHSELMGVELMRRKVKLYAAGGNGSGKLPHGPAGWNYQQDIKSAQNELAKLPTEFPTIYAGGSGAKAQVGNCYLRKPANHIIRICYEGFHQSAYKRKDNVERPTWDQLRMLYAARPSGRSMWDLSPAGAMRVEDDKTIHWEPTPNRNRFYAYVNDLKAMRQELETLMMHEPKKR